MANYLQLKAAIDQVIKANGQKEITGPVLNDTLKAIVNSLGAGYQFRGVATPSTNPGTTDQNVFYIAGQAGTYTNFNSIVLPDGVSILRWNGSWSSETVLAGDGVFDISAYKATGGTLATFADLSAALDGGNNIPSALRKGGMSVKFVLSSENKYVQFRLMAQTFSITVADWQGVDDEPTTSSKNLVESKGIKNCIEKVNNDVITTDIYTSTTDNFLDIDNVIELFSYDVGNRHFTDNTTGCIMSRPIYVGDTNKVYISGYDRADEERYVIFLSKANYTDSAYVDLFVLTGTSRLITVPSQAKYCVVILRLNRTRGNHYADMKLSKTESVATQSFNGVFLGNAGKEYLFNKNIAVESDIENIQSQIDALPKPIIYSSSTDNFLDVDNVVTEYRIDYNAHFVENNVGGKISRFIYVGDAKDVTISGYNYYYGRTFIVFLSEALYDNSKIVDYFILTGTQRTVTVPNGSQYAVVSLLYDSTQTDDYTTMKVSKSTQVATSAFVGFFLWYGGQEKKLGTFIDSVEAKGIAENETKSYIDNNLILSPLTQNVLKANVLPCGYRITDDSPYFVANTSTIISEPIPVEGGQMTWKSSMNSPTIRWVAFCSDKSKSAESVISVVNPGFALNTSAEQTKTINIPANTKYIFVTLKAVGASDTSYLNDTLAFGTIATYEEYQEAIVGFDNLPISDTQNTKYAFVKKSESTEVLRRAIPYSIGTPTENLSIDNQYDRVNLLYFTDSHIDIINPIASLQNVEDTVKFAKECPIKLDAVLHGGDVITPFGLQSKASQKTNIARFFDECKKLSTPVIFSVGNHDTNDWGNLYADSFGDADWSEIWYDWAEENYGIVRQTKASGEKSTWHYYDIVSKKIRIICLDVQDVDKTLVNESGKVIYYGGVAWYISNEQFNWVVSTALNFDDKDEKDWGVIILSHQDTKYGFGLRNPNNFGEISEWVSGTSYVVGNLVKYQGTDYRCKTSNNDANFDISKWDGLVPEKDIDKFVLMLQAFNTQSTYQENYLFPSVPFYGLSINADFTRYANIEKKPFVIAWIVGHEHFDFNNTVNGINIICTLNGSAMTSSSDARVARISGTTTQNAFDLISIDRRERKIRYVRYGAGKNCYGVGGDRFLPSGLSF